MFQLPVGLGAFALPHLWKRLAPASRARLGNAGKGVVTLLSIGGIWLMARGYGAWDDAPFLWQAPSWLWHVNNLLVLAAFYLFAASGFGAWGARAVRHPQLTAVALWAVAHLLVNGDAASVVLFGGLLLWALATILLINRDEPLRARPPRQPVAKEITAVVVAIAAYGIAGYVHGRIGPWPFGT
jgi:uncharacterized membrane protein